MLLTVEQPTPIAPGEALRLRVIVCTNHTPNPEEIPFTLEIDIDNFPVARHRGQRMRPAMSCFSLFDQSISVNNLLVNAPGACKSGERKVTVSVTDERAGSPLGSQNASTTLIVNKGSIGMDWWSWGAASVPALGVWKEDLRLSGSVQNRGVYTPIWGRADLLELDVNPRHGRSHCVGSEPIARTEPGKTNIVTFASLNRQWRWLQRTTAGWTITGPTFRSFLYTPDLHLVDPAGNEFQLEAPSLPVTLAVPEQKVKLAKSATHLVRTSAVLVALSIPAHFAPGAGSAVGVGMAGAAWLLARRADSAASTATDPPRPRKDFNLSVAFSSIRFPRSLRESEELGPLRTFLSLVERILERFAALEVIRSRQLGAKLAFADEPLNARNQEDWHVRTELIHLAYELYSRAGELGARLDGVEQVRAARRELPASVGQGDIGFVRSEIRVGEKTLRRWISEVATTWSRQRDALGGVSLASLFGATGDQLMSAALIECRQILG